MEAAILEQLELGELSPEAKAEMEKAIGEVYASKLILACAGVFSELELGRMEYLMEQNDEKALQQEMASHIKDTEAFLTAVADDTIKEIRENIAAIAS